MAKKALITGVTGQDGSYLAKLLLEKGYEVYGAVRRSASTNLWRFDYLGIRDQVKLVPFELLEFNNIARVLADLKPDELYNLAAQSFVATSFEMPLYTAEADGMAVTRILEALRQYSPDTRFYQASTSEMFGKVQEVPQTESTPFYPRSPYGVAKLYGHWITVNYRDSYNIHGSSGILFNHESPLRGLEFVTRKVTSGLASVKHGYQSHIELGNMDSRRDWGFAGDYVEGMWRMLQQPTGGDYILSTNETYTIRNFVELTGQGLGMKIEWQGTGEDEVGIDTVTGNAVVTVNPKFYRPAEVDLLIGDSKKAEAALGWKRQMSFEGLVETMTKADNDRASRGPIYN